LTVVIGINFVRMSRIKFAHKLFGRNGGSSKWAPEGGVELELSARHPLHLLAETLEKLLQLVPELAFGLK
jgi:hypothetical protein